MSDDKDIVDKAHSAFLTEDEKVKIQKQVEKELDEELKKQVASDYKASLKSAARKKALMRDAPAGSDEEGLIPVFIDLPRVSECIRLDGTAYYPGRTYSVTPNTKAMIEEIMFRGQAHEDEVSGRKDANQYRRRLNPTVRV